MKRMVVFLVATMMLLSLLAYVGANGEASDASDDLNEMGEKNPYLVLVNKEHRLPDDWTDEIRLDIVGNALGEKSRIEHETCAAFITLREELTAQGIQIELDSAYRSVEEQQEIWDDWSADPELGEEYCKKYLAVPGFSEHHTGLAVDIFLMKDGEIIRENDDMIADEEDFAVIHGLLPKYGFILRYPKGKEDVTGYSYEPWHLRYVGDAEIAKAITDKGITLEEYLEPEKYTEAEVCVAEETTND